MPNPEGWLYPKSPLMSLFRAAVEVSAEDPGAAEMIVNYIATMYKPDMGINDNGPTRDLAALTPRKRWEYEQSQLPHGFDVSGRTPYADPRNNWLRGDQIAYAEKRRRFGGVQPTWPEYSMGE